MADALVITGPTASGKSAVALEVARRLGGEIISMDSRQVYRGMDIGTAKPATGERAAVPHHGLDLVDPDQRYSAGQFARDARAWTAAIRARGAVPVVVGGTGFFLRALLTPLFAEPRLESARRERLKRWLARHDLTALQRWAAALGSAPPDVRPTDRQRLARGIEVALLTGRPLAWWHRASPPAAPPLAAMVVLLELPREELYRRIDERVHAMVRAGLVEEVRALLEAGYGPGDPGMNATGYIELIPHVRGERSLEEAITLIQNATRRYARRQLTWFRNQLPAGVVRLDAREGAAALAPCIVEAWRRSE